MTKNNLPRNSNAKEFIQQIAIIHFSLLMGQILFLGVAMYLHSTGAFGQGDPDLDAKFQIVIPVIAFGNVILGFFLYIQLIKKTLQLDSLTAKLEQYRRANLIRSALFEGGGLISIVAYLLTRNNLYFFSAAFIILLFLILFPSAKRVITDLRLTESEIQSFNDSKPYQY